MGAIEGGAASSVVVELLAVGGVVLVRGVLAVLVANQHELVLRYPRVGRAAELCLKFRLVGHLLVVLRIGFVEAEGLRGSRHGHLHLVQSLRLK